MTFKLADKISYPTFNDLCLEIAPRGKEAVQLGKVKMSRTDGWSQKRLLFQADVQTATQSVLFESDPLRLGHPSFRNVGFSTTFFRRIIYNTLQHYWFNATVSLSRNSSCYIDNSDQCSSTSPIQFRDYYSTFVFTSLYSCLCNKESNNIAMLE